MSHLFNCIFILRFNCIFVNIFASSIFTRTCVCKHLRLHLSFGRYRVRARPSAPTRTFAGTDDGSRTRQLYLCTLEPALLNRADPRDSAPVGGRRVNSNVAPLRHETRLHLVKMRGQDSWTVRSEDSKTKTGRLHRRSCTMGAHKT